MASSATSLGRGGLGHDLGLDAGGGDRSRDGFAGLGLEVVPVLGHPPCGMADV